MHVGPRLMQMGGESWPPHMEYKMKRGDAEGSNKASSCSQGRERESLYIHELMQHRYRMVDDVRTLRIRCCRWQSRQLGEWIRGDGVITSMAQQLETDLGPVYGRGEQIKRDNFSFFITERSMLLRPSSSKSTLNGQRPSRESN
ncbi:hypothetical protein GGI43DRAFT_27718 [Trichoderma evansii]